MMNMKSLTEYVKESLEKESTPLSENAGCGTCKLENEEEECERCKKIWGHETEEEEKEAAKESIKDESREPFGDFDYPEWMDDVEYHNGEDPAIELAFTVADWDTEPTEEGFMAISPSGKTHVAFHEGDKIMTVMCKLLSNARKHKQDLDAIENAFEEIKSAVEMTMTSPLNESEDGIDFKFINSTLDQIVKTVSDCKMTLQDLYRDARYGKAPATMERRQKVMQAMSDIRNFAHDISQEVK
jgi:uncharacterized protein YoxC